MGKKLRKKDLKRTIKQLQLELSQALQLIEELQLKLQDSESKIASLELTNKAQQDAILQLEKRLKIDSSNSSQPSSQDKFGKKKTTNNRDKTDKSSGGQPDHIGNTLQFEIDQDKIDVLIDHKPSKCEACGSSLFELQLVDTRQVHDVIITKQITNHLVYTGLCNCGCRTEVKLNIPHGVSYGNTIKSALLYLHNQDLIPSERLSQTSAALFGMPVNESSLYTWQASLANNLDCYEKELKARLLTQETLHADESGFKAAGRKWLHVICNADYTYYALHAKRGVIAMNDIGILNTYTGNLMHDCYKSYFTFGNITHGLCNAHLLRELRSVDQFYQLSFANQLRDLLKSINETVNKAKDSNCKSLDASLIIDYEQQYEQLLLLADTEVSTLSIDKWRQDTQALVRRLRKYRKEYLAFMYNFDMTFTNNQAERDIRMIKSKQKVSGGFRTEKFASHFLKIRGFVSTMRKQGKDILEVLQKIMVNQYDYNLSPPT